MTPGGDPPGDRRDPERSLSPTGEGSAPGVGVFALTGFEVGQAALIASWATSPEEALAWCSHPTFPVGADVVAGWAADPTGESYVLCSDEAPVGYGEVWIDDDAGEVELARLIVAPDHRGRGVGSYLTRALVERARRHHEQVFLRVRPDNERARRVYERAGFTPVPDDIARAWNEGQPVAYVWMQAGPTPDR